MIQLNGSRQGQSSRGLPPELIGQQEVLRPTAVPVWCAATLERLRHIDCTTYRNGYRIGVALPGLEPNLVRYLVADRRGLRHLHSPVVTALIGCPLGKSVG